MKNQAISAQLQELHRAFNANEHRAIAACYDETATVVSRPIHRRSGKSDVLKALAQFKKDIVPDALVTNGDDVVIEAGDVALVMSKIYLNYGQVKQPKFAEANRAIYVFKRNEHGEWRCVVDNIFGTDLLDYV